MSNSCIILIGTESVPPGGKYLAQIKLGNSSTAYTCDIPISTYIRCKNIEKKLFPCQFRLEIRTNFFVTFLKQMIFVKLKLDNSRTP